MRLKKISYIFFVIPLLCSFTRSGGTYDTVGITICSYTNITNAEEGNVLNGGYSFIEIENNRSWSLDLGYYQLPPFYKCTLSVWSSPYNNPYSIESTRLIDKGLFFNREAYMFNHTNMQPTDCLKYYVEVPQSVFSQRMHDGDFSNDHYLKTITESYNSTTFNSSRFAQEFFKKATNLDILPLYGTPTYLRHSIGNLLGHTSDNTVFEKSEYFRFNSNGVRYDYP
jgi:hypothetical protein